jgi:Ca2+-binding RTX toxin-like protein
MGNGIMATIRFGGYFYVLNSDGNVSFSEAEMTWVTKDYVTDFEYSILVNSGPVSEITANWDGFLYADVLANEASASLLNADFSIYLGTYGWSDETGAKQSDILDAELSETSGFVFVLDGDETPDLTNAETGQTWLASVTSYTWVNAGDLQPDEQTRFEDLSGGEIVPSEPVLGSSGADRIITGAGQDIVRAGAGDDHIVGGAGNDRLHGHRGRDTIYGGKGDDRLRGGAGEDILVGGAGDDIMRGGFGADSFVFASDQNNGFDRIKDFQDGVDRLIVNGGASFNEVTLETHTRGTLISLDQTKILLVDIAISDVSTDDFVFA